MMTKPIKKYHPVNYYYVADPSFWPIIGSIGIFCTVLGLVKTLHHSAVGPYLIIAGLSILVVTIFGWFGMVINESLKGLHSEQMDRTYRWAMLWFIVSEVGLFFAFFMALFYARLFAIPELGGDPFQVIQALSLSKGETTHQYLWPHFQGTWPLLTNPNPALFKGPSGVIGTWGIPAWNTLLLLSSAVTVTWAHWGLKKGDRKRVLIGLMVTILLGVTFEAFQAHEYFEAYTRLNLTLASGIYGTTFFTLTGLHALHVSLGIIMLTVIWIRCFKGHFLPEHHFGFEAVSWYWHFVDVVWLFLFVFVYWL